jgi:hypothetical protein
MNQFHRFRFGNQTAPIFTLKSVRLARYGGATNITAQVWLNTNLVRLQKAVLCANCEVISEGLNGHCAACGSQSLLRLSRVLGGTIDSKLSVVFATSAHAVNDDVRVRSLSAAA